MTFPHLAVFLKIFSAPPPIQLFAELGWQTLSALEGVFGIGNGQSMEGTVHAFQRQTPKPRRTRDLLLLRLLSE